MPSQMCGSTENGGAPQLAAIQESYELAKARIAGDEVPTTIDDRVPDTIAVDVRLAKPPLTGVVQRMERDPGAGSDPPAAAPRRRRRGWRSLLVFRPAGQGLPAA